MRLVLVALVLCLAVPAVAEEGHPVSLGVTSGLMVGSNPWRPAPTVNLAAAVPLGTSWLSLVGGLGGWTFAAAGLTPSRTELLASLGVSVDLPLSHQWTWSVAASPALAIAQAANAATVARPGFLLSPTFQYSTRRRTLSLVLGPEALVLSDGFRFGATAGVAYTFR